MKNLLYIPAIAFLLSCKNSGQQAASHAALVAHDTTARNTLSKAEFQYYSNVVKNHFEGSLLNRGFNGQMLIAKNGTVVFEKTVGFADMRSKDSLSENTPMHIASVSKTFTSMAILHLMEAGSLNLDDTLGKFFPGFPYTDVTVKMLLSHRSGLPNYLNYLSLLKKEDTCYTVSYTHLTLPTILRV